MTQNSACLVGDHSQIYDQLELLVGHAINNWREDLLVVDKEIIGANPGRSFVHVARENGTYLFLLPVPILHNDERPYLFGRATPLNITQQELSLIETEFGKPLSRTDQRVFTHYNGRSISVVDHSEICRAYRQAYHRVVNDWNVKQGSIRHTRGAAIGA